MYLTRTMANDFIENDTYYTDLGLQCGLEIHQQLLTEKKLFCRCRAVLHNDKPTAVIVRHMRPTLSELGEYDGTALMEFKTKKNVYYQLYNDTVCTYEMDDTPPFRLNQQALDIALEIALLLNYSIVDEIHISRKQYLDGSIPTGFQRTGIVGVEGWIPYKDREIRLIQLGLEEDACREVRDAGHKIIFKTDRLSIPLVEVVTHPDIKTPVEAGEVARLIGRSLRSTGKVRRGLGSIRQDINVSITGGTRVELKGVPKLQYIPKAVAHEARRQKALLEIRDELRFRGITEKTVQSDHEDVTSLFKHSRCKRLKDMVKNKGKIHGIILRGFAGILEMPTQKDKTFTDELAGRVRVIACLDNMPNIISSAHFQNFGLSDKEINTLKKLFNQKTTDTIVLTWGNKEDVQTAIEEIKIRAIEATKGVPSETRQVFPDGTNDFERILPGPNRMYPDTDTPPTPITEDKLTTIKKEMPEPLWECEKRLQALGMPQSLITSLSTSKNLTLFDSIIENININPTLVAVTLQETMKWLRRQGKQADEIPEKTLFEIFQMVYENKCSKEAIPHLLSFLAENPNKTAQETIEELHITPLSKKELEDVVTIAVTKYENPGKSKPLFNKVMGEVMKVARYGIDGKIVSNMVQTKLGISQ